MKDDDINAFGAPRLPAAASAPEHRTATPAGSRRPLWPWLLPVFGVALLLLALAGVSALHELLDGAPQGLQISVDGLPVVTLHNDADIGVMAAIGGTAAVLLLLLALMLALPVGLLLVLLTVALTVGLALLSAVAAGVLAAGALLLVVATALAPLWGAALLLWLLLRRRTGASAQARRAGQGSNIIDVSSRQAAAAS